MLFGIAKAYYIFKNNKQTLGRERYRTRFQIISAIQFRFSIISRVIHNADFFIIVNDYTGKTLLQKHFFRITHVKSYIIVFLIHIVKIRILYVENTFVPPGI